MGRLTWFQERVERIGRLVASRVDKAVLSTDKAALTQSNGPTKRVVQDFHGRVVEDLVDGAVLDTSDFHAGERVATPAPAGKR